MDVIIVAVGRLGGSKANLLISIPMNANGAHPDTAQGIPQTETKKVANFNERAMGANIIVPAKTR